MRIDSALYYVLKDHLGSASVVTDSSGMIVGEQRYFPFGETRLSTGTMFTDRLFTGQREMASLGIYYYGARFYSPKLGRFLSPDTIVPPMAGSQSLNRYSYVMNNSLNYTDPTGHKPCWATKRYSCKLSQKIADREYARYNDKDKAAVAKFFESQGFTVKSKGGGDGGAGGFVTPPMSPVNPGSTTSGIEGGGSTCSSSYCDPRWVGQYSSADNNNAILWGFGFSGSEPGIYKVAGMEELYFLDDHTRAVYDYLGQGGSYGEGASGAAYGGIVYNVEEPEDYAGPFGSGGITMSVLDLGFTAGYFWDTKNDPFTPGNTQGWFLGYAPGAQASVWWSTTWYELIWRTPPQ